MIQLGLKFRWLRKTMYPVPGHIPSSQNQSVKRANELSIAGLLTKAYLLQVVMLSIDSAKKSTGILQGELLKNISSITGKIAR